MNIYDDHVENPYNVTTTLQDAAKDILSKSFTIFKLDDPTTQNVKIAHREAKTFFQRSMTMNHQQKNEQQQQLLLSSYQRILNGNLYGYNEPSPSKLLFRAYCYCHEEEDNNVQQPWPTQNFQKTSRNLVMDLHLLLEKVYQQIQILHFNNNHRCKASSSTTTGPKTSLSSSPPRKRIRQDNIIADHHADDGDEKIMAIIDPNHTFDKSTCPLDYFFYHNQNPSFENCTEHVDRGVLILVCLTNVPGLEVYYDYDPETREEE